MVKGFRFEGSLKPLRLILWISPAFRQRVKRQRGLKKRLNSNRSREELDTAKHEGKGFEVHSRQVIGYAIALDGLPDPGSV